MSLNLSKGEKLDITKGGLTVVKLGLGWDVNAGNDAAFDLDASVVLLNAASKVIGPSIGESVVYFGNLNLPGVKHFGDNLTGAGSSSDKEVVEVKFADVKSDVEQIVFVVNIYEADSRNQRFGRVKNAFIRVYNPDTNEELGKYDLTEDYSSSTGVRMGKLYRHNSEWKFETIGEGVNGDLNAILAAYL